MNPSGELQLLRAEIARVYRTPEAQLLPGLMALADIPKDDWSNIQHHALQLIDTARNGAHRDTGPWIAELLRRYPIHSSEGRALMGLAECCLRVPDAHTTSLLIRDKLSQGNWCNAAADHSAASRLVQAGTLGLRLGQALLNDRPSAWHKLLARLSEPAIRHGTRLIMGAVATQFVYSNSIKAALNRAQREGSGCSFDMLGEAARTAADAQRYFDAYRQAIAAVGTELTAGKIERGRHSVSIKLSALHPRYETLQADRALPELITQLSALAQLAMTNGVGLTIDAEECDRLDLSLDVIEQLLQVPALRGWNDLSVAVQAYQKRALAVIKWLDALAHDLGRRIGVRLVKGAYWDTEIKRCQERGLSDFPVFTRKAATDVSYLACAKQLLVSEHLAPAFATHNALTIATLLAWIGTRRDVEFQRLHGMAAGLYANITQTHNLRCRVYAPVGAHHELLPYLIRRMLENSSNSGFVQQLGNPNVSTQQLVESPVHILQRTGHDLHPAIRAPADLFEPRRNSAGLDLSDRNALRELNLRMHQFNQTAPWFAQSCYQTTAHGQSITMTKVDVLNPADPNDVVGQVTEAAPNDVTQAITTVHAAMVNWSLESVDTRAACLERVADLLEASRESLMALLIREAGKTRSDALSEVREAVDFCRYYAQQAREVMREQVLPGPSGEFNALTLRARGVFACISPWNFPLAIFLGQIAAALVTGNGVVAKPAPQTPLIAAFVIRLLHQAGVPAEIAALLPGGPQVGEQIVRDRRVAGIAFTGSTSTARRIALSLLEDQQRPLTTLIAETGGINAMIVDSTALPEQVVADVITSAFQSAGQRCSALRLLCLQEDIYDNTITLLSGAMAELRVGNPQHENTDVGPLIDKAAYTRIKQYLADNAGRTVFSTPMASTLPGWFIAPTLISIEQPQDLQQEIFGPVLHVTKWRAGKLPELIDAINAGGYGLTLGLHSRLDSAVKLVRERAQVGNVYINRSMIGAVVGSQPFGGENLSGTGPKAGGPHYLARFCTERTVSIDTTSAGGDASLLSL